MFKNIYYTSTLEEKKVTESTTQEVIGERLGIKHEVFTKTIKYYSEQSEH